jgi:hypothetical protein
MTARKERRKREPLLNTVARKLGHAAGSFTKATQEFTEALSGVPQAVTSKVRDAAFFGASSDDTGGRLLAKKSTAARKRKAKKTARTPKKRSPRARRSPSDGKSGKKKKKTK